MHAFSSLDIDDDWPVMSLTSNNIYVFECFIFFIVKKMINEFTWDLGETVD